VNFAGFEHEADVTVADTMGRAAQRLDQVRAKYDPEGVFSLGVPVR
jgi:hypothetical protein